MQNADRPNVHRVVEATEYGGPDDRTERVAFFARLEGGFRFPYSLSVEKIIEGNRDVVQYIAHTHAY